jgi:hypothetical protein
MPQFGGKNAKKTKKTSSSSKRHFTVVMGDKEHGLYVSSTPSSAARKAVTKLCTANKSKKVQFEIREITQGSKKKTYGPYSGHIEKLKEPIKLKGREIKYKPVAKLSGKSGAKKGGGKWGNIYIHRTQIPKSNIWTSPEDWIDKLPKNEYTNIEKEFMKNYDFQRKFEKFIPSNKTLHNKISSNEIKKERMEFLKDQVHKKSAYNPESLKSDNDNTLFNI